MGYRSHVVLAIGEALVPQFMVTLAKCPEARVLCFGDADKQERDFQDEKGSFFFEWEGIKWYDSFEEIRAITDFMDWAQDRLKIGDKEIDGEDFYRFVRIGEEYDDIETRGWGFEIHPVRSIEY
jgi:hypothetical protein